MSLPAAQPIPPARPTALPTSMGGSASKSPGSSPWNMPASTSPYHAPHIDADEMMVDCPSEMDRFRVAGMAMASPPRPPRRPWRKMSSGRPSSK